ncbi:MAG: G5 domain-containing protein [Symbiobacterium sp.]|uniref:G5 domain-containing protein n=1 Tax=Symbiobacterium sp. TaxID=1971213 RepID=UPI003464AC10
MHLTVIRRRLLAGGAAVALLAWTLGFLGRQEPPVAAAHDPEPVASMAAAAEPEERLVPVTIIDGGHRITVTTGARTVADLLQERSLALGELDSLSVPGSTLVTPGMEIQITRRVEQLESTVEEIPYDTVERADNSLVVGTTELLQDGRPGLKRVERRVLYEDGQVVSSEVVGETVLEEPTPAILAYGTLGVVSRGGQEYRYTEELEMIATAYTPGPESNPDGSGLTYTGIPARRGVVAVDPSVIPLYTRVYVEGYGPAVAADTGGAIRGNRIDVCFDTLEEALAWGVRRVRVYVLAD